MNDILRENDLFYMSERFQSFFTSSPQSLILAADLPAFTVLAVSDNYLALTHKERHEVLNKGLFEVYPGSQGDPEEKLSVFSSFQRAIKNKQPDELPIF
jgi:hypothetical protein